MRYVSDWGRRALVSLGLILNALGASCFSVGGGTPMQLTANKVESDSSGVVETTETDDDGETDDGSCDSSSSPFGGGDGTTSDPYRICSSSHLVSIASYSTLAFDLHDDIDLTGVSFTPVTTFSGSLNGNDYSVSDFSYSVSTGSAGFILTLTGTLSDISFTDVYIRNSDSSGGAAALVVLNEGTLAGVSVAGDVGGFALVGGIASVNTGTITGSTSSATIYGETYAGGIVGKNEGTITSVTSSGSVVINNGSTGTSTGFGGVAGANESSGSIDNAIYSGSGVAGSVNIGGLAGYNLGTISSSSVSGVAGAAVSIQGDRKVGGLVGHNYDGIISSSSVVYATLTYLTSYAGFYGHTVGGLVGQHETTSVGVIESSSVGSTVTLNFPVSLSNIIGGFVGYNGGVINDALGTGSYSSATLQCDLSCGGFVGKNDSNGDIESSYSSSTVTGGGRITGGAFECTKLGGFVGFNQGSISSAYASGDVSISSTVSCGDATTSCDCVGGFAGDNSGTIIGSTSQPVYAGGSVMVAGIGSAVGGFAGRNSWSISYAYSTGTVDCRSTSARCGGFVGSMTGGAIDHAAHTAGSVTASYYVGGFVGYLYATDTGGAVIDYSYSSASVIANSATVTYVGGFAGVIGGTGATITSSVGSAYASGAVSAPFCTGTCNAGGFVGAVEQYGSVQNSYSTGDIDSGCTSNCLVGGFLGANNTTTGVTLGNLYSIGNVDDAVSGATNDDCDSTSYTSSFIGGFAGYSQTSATSSVYDTVLSGCNYNTGGATGMSTALMQLEGTYSGWDFSTIWYTPSSAPPTLRGLYFF